MSEPGAMSPELLFNRFRVDRVLTRRGSVRTLACVDARGRRGDERIVLKAFEEPTAADRERLRRRADALRTLDHPGLARCLGYVEGEACAAVVYQWVEGETLADQIANRRRWTDDELWQALGEMLSALHHAHDRESPVVHRDVKPQNVVHDGERYVLIDFGAAREIFDDTGNTSVVGTTGYAAPEQFVGRAVPATDQYGVAATVLHMATHRHPGDFPLERLRIDLSETDLSSELRKVLQRMLEPSPDGRFPDAAVALDAVESGRGVEAWEDALAPLERISTVVEVARRPDGLVIDIEPRVRKWSLFLGPFLALVFVGTFVALLVFPGSLAGGAGDALFDILMFAVLLPGMYAVPHAFMEFRRSRRARVEIEGDRWRIETRGFLHHDELEGDRSALPEFKQTSAGTLERPLLQLGAGERAGLVAYMHDGSRIKFGGGMYPVEAEAVEEAIERFLGTAASAEDRRYLEATHAAESTALTVTDETALVPASTKFDELMQPVHNPIRWMYILSVRNKTVPDSPRMEKWFAKIPDAFVSKLESRGFRRLGYTQERALVLPAVKNALWASPDGTILVDAHPGGMGQAEPGVTYHVISLTESGVERWTWSHESPSTPTRGKFLSVPTSGAVEKDLRLQAEWIDRHRADGDPPVAFQTVDDRAAIGRYYNRHLAAPKTVAVTLFVASQLVLGLAALIWLLLNLA